MLDSREDSFYSEHKRTANFPLIYLLGVATVLGTQVSYWNEGMDHGFWPFIVSFIFMASGYVCLALCLCEMTAALPFSGGTFGLARVTLGQVAGYLIASFEMAEYMMYTTLAVHSMGELLTEATGADRKFEPIYWLIFYICGFVVQLSKPAIMWSFIALIGMFLLAYMSVFIIATPGTAHANFTRYAIAHHSVKSAPQFLFNWFRCMPNTSWFFLGIETLPVASGDTIEANKTIPRAIQTLLVTIICTATAIVFAASSVFPGATSDLFQRSASPLSFAYSLMLNISYTQATAFTIVIKCITGFGFMFAYGRQISAMHRSGLIMTFVSDYSEAEDSVRRGLILGFVLSYGGMGFTWAFGNGYFRNYHSACLLGNYLVCLGILSSYIVFRSKFGSLAKNYRSVLGIYGAGYGIVVFTVAFVSLAGFQNDHGVALIVLMVLVTYMSGRYIVFNLGKPTMSTEEQSVLFVLYIIKANTDRKRMLHEHAMARNHDCNPSLRGPAQGGMRGLAIKIKRSADPLRASITSYITLPSGLKSFNSSDDEEPSRRRTSGRLYGSKPKKKSTRIVSNETSRDSSLSNMENLEMDSRRSTNSVISLSTIVQLTPEEEVIAELHDQAVVMFETSSNNKDKGGVILPPLSLFNPPSSNGSSSTARVASIDEADEEDEEGKVKAFTDRLDLLGGHNHHSGRHAVTVTVRRSFVNNTDTIPEDSVSQGSSKKYLVQHRDREEGEEKIELVSVRNITSRRSFNATDGTQLSLKQPRDFDEDVERNVSLRLKPQPSPRPSPQQQGGESSPSPQDTAALLSDSSSPARLSIKATTLFPLRGVFGGGGKKEAQPAETAPLEKMSSQQRIHDASQTTPSRLPAQSVASQMMNQFFPTAAAASTQQSTPPPKSGANSDANIKMSRPHKKDLDATIMDMYRDELHEYFTNKEKESPLEQTGQTRQTTQTRGVKSGVHVEIEKEVTQADLVEAF